MSESVHIENITSDDVNGEHLFDHENLEIPQNVILYEINGPLFFGAARQFQETITQTSIQPKAVVIRMRYVPLIDATGFQSLKEIIKTFKSKDIAVIISGANEELLKNFEKYNLYEFIDKECIAKNINIAIEKAKSI